MATVSNAQPSPIPSSLPGQDTDPVLPQRLGRYLLLKLIARGGMGEVFLAACGGIEGAERPAVVKVIRREHAKDPSFMARFLDEARVQAQLQHPGVAQVLEASMDDSGQPFVVVEYVEGRSLAEVRARAIQLGVRIGWADAVAVAASVAEALAHVHERVDARGQALNIAHRDLSPQNVMVGFSGETKLIDFGTARGANRRSRTVAGVVYAKPGYVAPEVANGIPGDAFVDVYALGVMIWELCAGRRFLQGDAGEHMAAVAQNRRPLPALGPTAGTPPELDQVIARMTTFDKAQRLSARDAHAELVKILTRAPALGSGERGVRPRIGAMLSTLYPTEPKRSRSEFYRLLGPAKKLLAEAPIVRAPEVDAPAAKIQQELADGLLPGTRYRLVKKIGEGSGGVVYEGVHIDLSRRVALKILTPDRASRKADATRFRREAWALSRVMHKNLVKLYDFGVSTDERLFFAMEYLEGETLERFLGREKAIPVADALRIGRETALALEAAHAVGLVHRDIKPSNLFLTKDGGLRVLDFGVVCAPGDGTGTEEGATPSLALFGTPEYMAPEQIDGSPLDGRADVYALGSVLYEMLTGRLPFVAESSISVLDAKRKLDPEPPSERSASRKLSPAVDELVMRAMARRPSDRFDDATAFRRAIERVERENLKGSPRRRAVGFAAVAAAMVGAMALLGASASQRLDAQPEAVRAAISRVDPLLKVLMGRSSPTPRPQIAAEVAAVAPEPVPAPVASAPAIAPGPAPATTVAANVVPAEPEAPKMPPAELEALKSKTRKAAAKHRWKLTRKTAEEWARAETSTPEPKILLGRSLLHLGLLTEAREIVGAVVESAPTSEEARELLGEIEKKAKGPPHKGPSKTAMAHGKHQGG